MTEETMSSAAVASRRFMRCREQNLMRGPLGTGIFGDGDGETSKRDDGTDQ
jgi:hypothetical protein